MGTNIISKESDLYLRLLKFQKAGIIGTIIEVIFIRNKLAGENYRGKTIRVLACEK
jgi:hypothetical protein